MYQHSDYKDQNREAVEEFIKEHPFAVLSGCDLDYVPFATQVPVFLEKEGEKWFLRGHMIKGADHHRAFSENPKVMLVFPGSHSYVSATWYSSQNQASTWNYMSVQVKGQIRFLGQDALKEILRKTTLHFEGGNQDAPTVYDNLDPSYVKRLLHAIAAFEVEVTSIDHVFKLSQDKDQASYENIVTHLKQGDRGAQTIAEEMEKRKDGLFG